MKTLLQIAAAAVLALAVSAGSASAPAFARAKADTQAVAGPEQAKPVAGDPGISSMRVMELPEFRVLRDYAEPGATRRMHSHEGTTYQVLILITGQIQLTVEGEKPIDVTPGQAIHLKGEARHTFTNTGKVTATLVEVFGKAKP